MEKNNNTSLLNTEYRLKDVVQLIGALLTAVVFIVTMNARIEALTTAVNDLRDNESKAASTNDLAIKSLQNQVNTQTIQISLIQKDVDMLKTKK